MTPQEVQQNCIGSADTYLEYLRDRNLGVAKNQIESMEVDENIIELKLQNRLFHFDYIEIEDTRNKITFRNPDNFKIVSYDSATRRLVIEVQDTNSFDPGHIEDYSIRTDFTILINNIREWYINNPVRMYEGELPTIKLCNLTELDEPDSDQQEAIECALSNKLSYIWGPPGSGKTHIVLTHCVFNYYRDSPENLIGVFAPTNNALEVMMGALLENADRLKIPKEKFLRLGVPSKEFADKYPEVCEVSGIRKKIEESKSQLKMFEDILHVRNAEHVNSYLNELNAKLFSYREEQSLLETILKKQQEDTKARNDIGKKLHSVSYRLKVFVGNWLNKKVNDLTEELKEIDDRLRKNQDNLIKVQKSQSDLRSEITKTVENIRGVSKKVFSELDLESVFGSEGLSENIISDVKDKQKEIEKYMEKIQSKSKESGFDIKEYEDKDNESICKLRNECKKKICKWEKRTVDERIKNTFVFGATLDGYIARYRNGNRPEFKHVFVDESGYVPLIKSLVLYGNCPLTLIGDHKQLPPICEMDEMTLNQKRDVALFWNKSSLFAESVFLHDQEYLIGAKFYLQNEPIFDDDNAMMQISKLTTTHRFGENLSNMLDEFFYNFGFHSSENGENVSLYWLNARMTQEPEKERENIEECNQIQRLIESRYIENNDYAVITPYRKQVSLLNHQIPQLQSESEAMTIHKSQGREWETLILSVVDGPYNEPWFTDIDILQAQARLVLNTAISRVKKNLFVVCDGEYWRGRPEQFITQLITEAKQIQFDAKGQVKV